MTEIRSGKCAGLFRPGDDECRICDRPKSAHQTAQRSQGQATARPLHCRCGREKDLRASRCESCEYERQLDVEYGWIYGGF